MNSGRVMPLTNEKGYIAKDPITIMVERNRLTERARSTLRATPPLN